MGVSTATRNFLRMMGGTVGLAACSAILNNSVQSEMHAAGISDSTIFKVTSDPTQINKLDIPPFEKEAALQGYSKRSIISLCQWIVH